MIRNFKTLVVLVVIADVLLTMTAVYLYNHLHVHLTP